MSQASPTPAAPAGWYPVAEGSTQLRYWDGAAWTDHLHEPATQATVAAVVPRQPLQPPRTPDGTNPNTPWAWVIALWPIVGLLGLIPTVLYFQQIVDADYSSPEAVLSSFFSPLYVIIALAGLVEYGLVVLFSALDYRSLVRAGVPRPFHWAWSFLSVIVYAIGRGVVVKRRTGRGLAPLWVFVALELVAFIVGIVITIVFTVEIFSLVGSFAVTQTGQVF